MPTLDGPPIPSRQCFRWAACNLSLSLTLLFAEHPTQRHLLLLMWADVSCMLPAESAQEQRWAGPAAQPLVAAKQAPREARCADGHAWQPILQHAVHRGVQQVLSPMEQGETQDSPCFVLQMSSLHPVARQIPQVCCCANCPTRSGAR